MLSLGLGTNRIRNSVAVDPVVEAFASANGITSSQEINALNALYVGVVGLIDSHGAGAVYYLNGISPTSLAASREAIIYSTGNQTAVDIGASPTHSTDGVEFNGVSNGWNLGNIINNKPQNELLTAFSRTNTITTNPVNMGSQTNVTNRLQFSARPTPNTSGYITGNQYTAGQNFGISGSYVGYNDGSNYAIWKDGVKQTPDTLLAISTAGVGTLDFYIGCRNLAGSPSNFSDDRFSLLIMLWDGGTLFNQTEIETLDSLMFNYNANVV